MAVELNDDARGQALASLLRYLREHADEPVGSVAAAGWLAFFLQEIAPSVYNQAVADAQARLQARVLELDIDVHEDEFTYWQRRSRPVP